MIENLAMDYAVPPTYIDLHLNEIAPNEVRRFPSDRVLPLNVYTVAHAVSLAKEIQPNMKEFVQFSIVRSSCLEENGTEQLIVQCTLSEAVGCREGQKWKLQCLVENVVKPATTVKKKKTPSKKSGGLLSPLEAVAEEAMTMYATQEGGNTREDCVRKLEEAKISLRTLKKRNREIIEEETQEEDTDDYEDDEVEFEDHMSPYEELSLLKKYGLFD
jgi:hypothetical protein